MKGLSECLWSGSLIRKIPCFVGAKGLNFDKNILVGKFNQKKKGVTV